MFTMTRRLILTGEISPFNRLTWIFRIYYETRKREFKTRSIYECRCDERLKIKSEKSTRLAYTGLLGELEHLKIETRFWNLSTLGFRFSVFPILFLSFFFLKRGEKCCWETNVSCCECIYHQNGLRRLILWRYRVRIAPDSCQSNVTRNGLGW